MVVVEHVQTALIAAGASVITIDFLAEGVACDLVFTRMEPAKAQAIAEETLANFEIDCIAQPAGERQKRLLIADMDSTIITVECLDEIADFAGIKPQIAAITERAMQGELEFIPALQERVALLKGLNASVLERAWNERVRFMPGARELVATMRYHGAYTVLVSGGFDFFTSRVREELGFDADFSNQLEIENGQLTGRVIPPVLDRHAKLQTLMQTCMNRNIPTMETLAVGDGANDVPMLVAAGLGVAYHAKPLVRQSTSARINCADLTALLYVQGYRKEQITHF